MPPRAIASVDLYSSPSGTCRVHKFYINGSETRDRHDRWLFSIRHDTVVVGSTRGPPYKASGSHGNTLVRIELRTAIHPPGSGHDNAETIGSVCMGRAHVGWMPSHKSQVMPLLSEASGEDGVFEAIVGKSGLFTPLDRFRKSNLGATNEEPVRGLLDRHASRSNRVSFTTLHFVRLHIRFRDIGRSSRSLSCQPYRPNPALTTSGHSFRRGKFRPCSTDSDLQQVHSRDLGLRCLSHISINRFQRSVGLQMPTDNIANSQIAALLSISEKNLKDRLRSIVSKVNNWFVHTKASDRAHQRVAAPTLFGLSHNPRERHYVSRVCADYSQHLLVAGPESGFSYCALPPELHWLAMGSGCCAVVF